MLEVIAEKIRTQVSGEHSFTFYGGAGLLEGICHIPKAIKTNHMVILGHPHSLHGGSMSNKVVTTLARAVGDLGIPSFRFNFRGVGRSEGRYDDGIGESEDMLELIHQIEEQFPESQFIFAGFSFGTYVIYRCAMKKLPRLLLMVAPAIERYHYLEQARLSCPWWIIQGDKDEVVVPEGVFEFAEHHLSEIKLLRFPGATHFFHGQLLKLREAVVSILTEEGLIS